MGVRIAGVLLIVVAAFGAWWITHAMVGSVSGFHVVDGYWLGPESTCTNANAPDYCAAAIASATPVLKAQRPDAKVVRAAIAPQSCDATTYVICTNGGMSTATVFVVFDLADGTRHAVGLLCQGAITDGSLVVTIPNCRPDNITNQESGTQAAGSP
jgi:hypothetical protein